MKNRESMREAFLNDGLSYKEIFELSPDLILIHDLNGNIIEANEAASRSTGYSKEELEGMNMTQLSDSYTALKDEFWEEIKAKEFAEFRGSHRRKDGSVYFVEVHVKLVMYKGEKVAIAIDRDITEKLQQEAFNAAQREIREYIGSTLNLDQIMKEVVTQAATTVGAETAVIALLEKDELIVRYAYGVPKTLIGSRIELKDIPQVEKLIADRESIVINDVADNLRSFEESKSLNFKSILAVPLIVHGGVFGFISLQYVSTPIGFTNEQIEFVNNLAPAVSLAIENSRLYQEAKQAADRLSLILNTVTDGIMVIDPKGYLVFMNEGAQTILGVGRKGMIGKKYHEIGFRSKTEGVSRSSSRTQSELMLKTLKSSVKDSEMTFIKDDGTTLSVLVNGEPLLSKEGEFEGSVISFTDITQRKLYEERLVRERDLMTLVMETNPAGILLLDKEGKIVMSNRRAQYLLGLTKATLTGLSYNDPLFNITDFEGDPIPDNALPFMVSLKTKESVYNLPVSVETPGKDRTLLLCNAAPIIDDAGEVERVVVTIEDVTDRIAAQAALDESLTTSRDIVDGIPIGITIYRFEPPDHLHLQSANPSASIVLHTDLSNDIGKEYQDIWGRDIVGDLKERILHSIRSGRSIRLEGSTIEGPRTSGSFSISIFRLPGDRVCVTYEDITRQMMEEDIRRRAHMQIEQNIEHYATLVDQIRNPLSVIIAISEMSSCKEHDRIRRQAESIEAILKQLDKGWVESEKIRAFLRKYI